LGWGKEIICNIHPFLPILNFGEMEMGPKNSEDLFLERKPYVFSPKFPATSSIFD